MRCTNLQLRYLLYEASRGLSATADHNIRENGYSERFYTSKIWLHCNLLSDECI